ncbi:hypothetical protein BHE74_00009122 [Ensete ventricosum]|nr:hypothetical protein BHE74_00009122 [Ensete ventricosum]
MGPELDHFGGKTVQPLVKPHRILISRRLSLHGEGERWSYFWSMALKGQRVAAKTIVSVRREDKQAVAYAQGTDPSGRGHQKKKGKEMVFRRRKGKKNGEGQRERRRKRESGRPQHRHNCWHQGSQARLRTKGVGVPPAAGAGRAAAPFRTKRPTALSDWAAGAINGACHFWLTVCSIYVFGSYLKSMPAVY